MRICGAVYLSLALLVLNVTMYFVYRKRFLDSGDVGKDLFKAAQPTLVVLFIVVPIVSVIVTSVMCWYRYQNLALLPAIFGNGLTYGFIRDVMQLANVKIGA